jgi:hypothetical protein
VELFEQVGLRHYQVFIRVQIVYVLVRLHQQFFFGFRVGQTLQLALSCGLLQVRQQSGPDMRQKGSLICEFLLLVEILGLSDGFVQQRPNQ